MKIQKHLYWVIGLVLITIIICGTLIWINHNSWTMRFEMDDNTKEAIQSINWKELNNNKDVKPVEELTWNFTDRFNHTWVNYTK